MKNSIDMKVKIPFLLCLLQIFLGVFIAILFAINEDYFKQKIEHGLKSNPEVVAMVDNNTTKDNDLIIKGYIEKETSKNWRYYQRFHFHSTGIAAMSMAVLFLIFFLDAPIIQKYIASYIVSLGGFLYPFVWLLAAIYGPSMGRDLAKEQFAVFGYMGGVFMIGVLFTLYLASRYPFKKFLN